MALVFGERYPQTQIGLGADLVVNLPQQIDDGVHLTFARASRASG
jgi:hypothetical protein